MKVSAELSILQSLLLKIPYVVFRVNKKYFDAMSSSLIGVNGTTDKEWVQVYRGIAAGLGKEGFDFEKCVKDGNHTVELFRESFAAFENNEIFKGVELLGTALMEIGKAFEDCGETDIAKALEKLATDFIECVKGKKERNAIERRTKLNVATISSGDRWWDKPSKYK